MGKTTGQELAVRESGTVGKRHKKLEKFAGIKKPGVKRMTQRAGITCVADLALEYMATEKIPALLQEILSKALVFREHGRKIINKQHIISAFEQIGMHVMDDDY